MSGTSNDGARRKSRPLHRDPLEKSNEDLKPDGFYCEPGTIAKLAGIPEGPTMWLGSPGRGPRRRKRK